MIKKAAPIVLLFSGVLGGCETMLAHYRMPPQNTVSIASGNAATNVCLSKNLIQRSIAYEYNTAGAQLLEISVFDKNLYSSQYQQVINEFKGMTAEQTQNGCSMAEQAMPQLTARMRAEYADVAAWLNKARSQEMAAMTNSLSNMGGSNYSSHMHNYSWPAVKFAPQQPQTDLYLVNTNSGLTQCRTTSSGYVFCM